MSADAPLRPRRIAVVSHSKARVGGVESYVASIVPALEGAGCEVGCWFESDGDGTDPVVPAGSAAVCWSAAEYRDGGIEAVRAWKPDLVYTHGVVSSDWERQLMRLAPAVCFAHSYYGACISGTKTWRVPAIHTCERTLGPGCLAQYYPRRCGGWNPATLVDQYRLQRTRLTLLGDYARILVASRHMAAEYARHGLADAVRVVPLPVEGPGDEPPAQRADDTSGGAPRGPWRLLFLGRFEETKGPHVALESAAIVAARTGRDVHLQISGDGSWRSRLTEQAGTLSTRQPNLHVAITPWLSSEQSVRALDRADALLVPSLWPEPFGLVGVEAARRGVPAVAFAVGGIPDWLIDGTTGRLVSATPPTAQAFASGIELLLGDPASMRRMREACRAAATRFGIDAHLRALGAVFDEVAGTSGRAA